MLIKGTTPPAWKFNAGQKILFWLVMLGGLGMIVTGAALLAPYRTGLVSKTFGLLASVGFALPTDAANLTPAQEVYYARMWHGALAIGVVLRGDGAHLPAHARHAGRVVGHDLGPDRRQHGKAAAQPVGRARVEAHARPSCRLQPRRRSDSKETTMDEEKFNMSLRKFLKQVGVTSQRELERVAREGAGKGKLKVRMVLTAAGTNLNHVVEEELDLG